VTYADLFCHVFCPIDHLYRKTPVLFSTITGRTAMIFGGKNPVEEKSE
jgi:hypothetical protein